MTSSISPAPEEANAGSGDAAGSAAPPAEPVGDNGWLAALCLLARLHHIAAEPAQLLHQLGWPPSHRPGVPDLLLAAKQLGLKAKLVRSSAERLTLAPLPALALVDDADGGRRPVVLAQCDGQRVLFQDPSQAIQGGRPVIEPAASFVARWTGELILVTSRASLAGDLAKFDFSWFIPSLVKYRRLFGEVLLISLFLQLFALVSPLFFQVVMDKVLVHRGLTTLDVLVIGLAVVILFESLLTALRTYVFSHTTSRIDVELGARLFRHLVSLPLAYFQSRRVGDSVARVRELENIRSFLTGNAMTLVLDVAFSVIFVAVMFAYSVPLTLIVLISLPLYAILSAILVPILRARLNEKFARGAENQALLVEAVTGIQTVKANALEPSMARRWDNQLAAYVLTSLSGTVKIQDAGGSGDVLILPDDVTPGSVQVGSAFDVTTGGTDALVLMIGGHGYIQIAKYLYSGAGPSDKIEEIRFAGGEIWRPADVIAKLPINNITNGDDGAIYGFGWAETIDALGGNDVVLGNGGDDWIDGNTGADALFGGLGNDTLLGSAGNDNLKGEAGNDSLSGGADDDSLYGGGSGDASDGANLLDGGSGNDWVIGGFGGDTIIGGSGNDQINGGSGDDVYRLGRSSGRDTLNEGAGFDRLVFDADVLPADVTLFRDNFDLLVAIGQTQAQVRIVNYFANVAYQVESLEFTGGTIWNAAAIVANTVAGTANAMTGTSANNTFGVDNAGDTITEGANQGTDTVNSSVSYTLPANVENITLTGYADVNASGNALANVITGNPGSNVLRGSAGDSAIGGAGDDFYYGGMSVVELAGGGIDTIFVSDTYTLPANVENLSVDTLLYFWPLRLTGNSLDNVITGRSSWSHPFQDIYDGGAGADLMIDEGGDGIFYVDNPGDRVVSASATVFSSVNWTLAPGHTTLNLIGSGAISATGNALANTLDGSANSAANVLIGGLGDDTYLVGAGDTVVELAGEGIDTYEFNYRPADGQLSVGSAGSTGIERYGVGGGAGDNLTLSGSSGADSLFYAGLDHLPYGMSMGGTLRGLEGDDTLVGSTGHDRLDGGSGSDLMQGGAGNDAYVVNSVGDTIGDSSGTDTVEASVSWVLAVGLENLTLTGSDAIAGYGNAQGNTLDGSLNSSANLLAGGAGDDTYKLGAGDTVVESAAQGRDRMLFDGSFVVSANVEDGTLLGTGGHQLIGNALANTLSGNAGANFIDGGLGADTMSGGGGSDAFVVDDVGDVVIGGNLTDLVLSTISHTLGRDVDNLTLTGTASINATGNSLGNVLTGNAAVNELDGAAGNDTLDGGLGNDTYVVDVATDVVTELAAAGSDTVQSSVSLTLAANVENLTLTGSTALNGTGNTLDNILIGNVAINVMTGGAGNDRLDGAAGADTLVGGLGNDTYVLGRGYGAELVQENDTTLGNYDVMTFLSGITENQLWFRQVGNDLEVSIIGTTDKALIQNWYLGTQYHVEEFRLSDNQVLLDSRVQDLVNAMAGFTPPALGQTTLPAAYQPTLLPIIAADWV